MIKKKFMRILIAVLLMVGLSVYSSPLYAQEKITKVTISAAGDCTLGKGIGFAYARSLNRYYDVHGPAYFFKKVKKVFDHDDLSIVNFEGDLTKSNHRVVKTFNFKGPAHYMKILKNGSIEAVSFANNHCRDYGEQGYQDTIKAFNQYDMPYASFNHVALYQTKGIKIGMIAVTPMLTGMSKAQMQVKNGIARLKKRGAQAIIVSMHCGIEGTHKVNDVQRKLAHYAINQGADLILGHHPHVLQGIEYYKGVPIAYSLANFCFGGNSNPKDKETMIFQKTFTFKNGKLERNKDVKIIPCRVSGKANINNYQPVVLKGKSAQRLFQHLRSYSKAFKTKITREGKAL